MRLEIYFDFSCPFAYLASTQAEALARAGGAELVWKPMLLGGVFRALQTPMNLAASLSPSRARNDGRDMFRWAELLGIPLRMPAGHPMRTVRALRTLLAVPERSWPALIREIYRSYWLDGRDIADPAVLADAVAAAGIEGEAAAAAQAANDDPRIKEELKRRTDEAIERGVFGAPTFFVTGDDPTDVLMFYGVDRLHMIEKVLEGWRPTRTQANAVPSAPILRAEQMPAHSYHSKRTLDFWYDFSSPFAYLGATQVEELSRRAGAELRYRPLLLGALFKEIGAPNVPLLAMSDAKRRYMGRELELWASYWQVPFRFNSHFPIRSVLPLRVALAAGPDIGLATQLLFRAAWVDDLDISEPAVVERILESAGLDGPRLVEATASPGIKAQLFANTKEARDADVFGVPSAVVRVDSGPPLLFWGQDRLTMVERALGGWIPENEAPGA